MKIHHRERPDRWTGRLLCVTHTERPVEVERCSLNFLTRRYADPARLRAVVPFEQLTPSSQHSPYGGGITVWSFADDDWRRPELLAHLEPEGYKPQHALWHRGRLWVLGVECLEVYDARLERLAVVEDPWLAGAHTIAPDGWGRLLLSCSASDAVLMVDEDSLNVVAAVRLPEALYGHNYSLKRSDSVVRHYVANELQLTHINCAWPYQRGVLISTLIQGAIGWFGPEDDYRELARGFVGCHGVRVSEAGEIYFSDSCQGTVVFLDGRHRIARRVAFDSRWLHDALQLAGPVWAVSPAERNRIILFDLDRCEPIRTIDCTPFGASTQFLSLSR